MIRPYKGVVAAILLLQISVIIFTLPRPWLIKVLIDQGAVFEGFPVVELILVLLGLSLVSVVLFFVATYNSIQIARIVVHKARLDFYRHVQSLGYTYYDRTEVGDVFSRFRDLSLSLPTLLQNLLVGVGDLLAVIVFSVLLVLIDPRVAIVAAVAGVFSLVVFLPMSRMFSRGLREKAQCGADMASKTFEYLSSMKLIQALTAEKKAESDIRKSYSAFRDWDTRVSVIRLAMASCGEMFLSILIILSLYYALKLVARGEVQLGTLAMVVMTLRYLMAPAQRLARLFAGFQEGLVHVSRFFHVLRIIEGPRSEGEDLPVDASPGDLVLHSVTFSYDGSGEVLKDIDLTAKKGELVAIVGPSGSGKTTLANLLPRFYEIERGSIKLGERDIRDIPLDTLRGMISVVPQEPVIFTGTVRDNITFGRPDATLEEVINAAKKAQIHSRIERMPKRYDTWIGYRGYRLSGGEKQRVAMARAILQDRPILILDEATSYLDVENEALLQKAIREVTRDRTTLVIAHRLSTVRNADRIFVLKDGAILESGNHDHLVQRGGYYAGLVKEFG
jgi:ABC-type multidrug transport system fused ATPase/permease subunit